MTTIAGEVRRWHAASGGQAVVELALLLPFLALIVMGTVDFGRVFYTYGALANAAREGARYCALHLGDTAGTRARISGELGGRVTASLASTVCPGPPATTSGQMVTVWVEASVVPITPLVASIAGSPSGTLDVRVSASMEGWA